MRPQKCLPRRRPLRHGREPMRLQDPRNRGSADTMSEILERPANPAVAPGGILLRHAHDEPPDLREHTRTTAPPLRVRPLPRDQLPMPPENRVWRDDRGDLTQPPTSQPVPADGEPTPLVLAQPKAPATQLTPQDSVLFDQIGQGLLLLTIQPADQRGKNNPQGGDVDHGRSLHQRPRPN